MEKIGGVEEAGLVRRVEPLAKVTNSGEKLPFEKPDKREQKSKEESSEKPCVVPDDFKGKIVDVKI